jgi:hypothetical protein
MYFTIVIGVIYHFIGIYNHGYTLFVASTAPKVGFTPVISASFSGPGVN